MIPAGVDTGPVSSWLPCLYQAICIGSRQGEAGSNRYSPVQLATWPKSNSASGRGKRKGETGRRTGMIAAGGAALCGDLRTGLPLDTFLGRHRQLCGQKVKERQGKSRDITGISGCLGSCEPASGSTLFLFLFSTCTVLCVFRWHVALWDVLWGVATLCLASSR